MSVRVTGKKEKRGKEDKKYGKKERREEKPRLVE